MFSIPLPESDKDYLLGFRGVFPNEDVARQYLYDSWGRVQVVLAWLNELRQKGVRDVLELGSNPYNLTLLMKKYFDFEVHLANFFGDSTHAPEGVHSLENGSEKFEFPFKHFNIEADPFPYAKDSFDCVLFCEILEHLLLNPDLCVREIHRVLKPGGVVIITTPNAARLANVVRLLRGRNIYDNYSVHGAYGRHNREYTLPEVRTLLERNSFEVVQSKLVNIYPHPLKSRIVQALRPNTWYEHIFVMGSKKS